MLVDHEIHALIMAGVIGVSPYNDRLIQPASLDVRLGDQIRTETGLLINLGDWWRDSIRSARERAVRTGAEIEVKPFMLGPGEFMLAHTMERVRLGNRIAARVEGKSSIGRLGLAIHVTAGFIDPGFEGEITLELKNMTRSRPIPLIPGERIGQMSFQYLGTEPERPYGHPALGSHYQGQTGPTPAWGA